MQTDHNFRFNFTPMNAWPPLAWLAWCWKDQNEINILHGTGVETSPEWICEAAWDGPFAEGGIDRTDIICGTGIRLRGDRAIFVSSGSTVDRIVSCETGERLYVSNSLVALASCVDITVDPSYERFYEDFRTIINGINEYKQIIETSNPPVRLTYFRNLVFDGKTLVACDKPYGDRVLASFADYRSFLEESLLRISANMADVQRGVCYTPLGTLSTGYDSPTVATVSRVIGNMEVLTFVRSRDGAGDDGREIAARLGLQPVALDRNAWRELPGAEIPFIAADAYGEEMHFTAASPYLSRRLLLTGYHGGRVWDASTHDLSPVIKRGDPSGLALTEWRLWTGFLHCAVPFFGARNIDQIYRITVSEEMKPWRIGGHYDRPICRRIVEQEGIPREMFGQQKKASSVVLWNYDEAFLPPRAMNQYVKWLNSNRMHWLSSRQMPPVWALKLHSLKSVAARVVGKQRGSGNNVSDYLFRNLFPWALDSALRRYTKPPAVTNSGNASLPQEGGRTV